MVLVLFQPCEVDMKGEGMTMSGPVPKDEGTVEKAESQAPVFSSNVTESRVSIVVAAAVSQGNEWGVRFVSFQLPPQAGTIENSALSSRVEKDSASTGKFPAAASSVATGASLGVTVKTCSVLVASPRFSSLASMFLVSAASETDGSKVTVTNASGTVWTCSPSEGLALQSTVLKVKAVALSPPL